MSEYENGYTESIRSGGNMHHRHEHPIAVEQPENRELPSMPKRVLEVSLLLGTLTAAVALSLHSTSPVEIVTHINYVFSGN